MIKKKREFNMLEKYLYEIMAAVAIVILLMIYVIIKAKTSSKNSSKEDFEKEIQIRELDKKAQDLAELQTVKTDNNVKRETIGDSYDIDFDGTEEGNFGEVEEEKETIKQKTISKRSVPQHGKITKQDFTEFSGERILVAEDNLINQKVLTGLLAGSGIEVSIANDGQEALDILENDSDFLMILMDAHMPRVDGFEATRIIRKNSNYDHILVVALSGDTASDDIAKMKNAGMSEQLEKPLRMEALYEIFYAYTGKNEDEENDDFIEVVMTKELNGDKGLEVCGGDEIFYREILNEFISTYENSTQKLDDLLHNGNIKEADKLLLDIIGITANIGADPLNKIANEIKNALNDSEEKSYLTLSDQYNTHLEILILDIKNYINL